jgi:ATP-binding protein involved in chromosome partitioning
LGQTHSDHDFAELEQLVKATLASFPTTAERFAGVSLTDNGRLKIDLWSDGLSLDDKAAMERAVSLALQQAFAAGGQESPSFYCNFRRKEAAPPVAGRQRKGAFGIQPDRRAIPGVTHIIAVASGKGGVGKSTVSTNLAVAAAALGKRVALLDADIYGPSVPVMLGVSGPMQVNAEAKLIPLKAHGVSAASFGFLTDVREPAIWRGPMISKAFSQLAYDVAWGETDILIIDLPPGTGDIQLAMLEQLPVHAAVVVTTPQTVALHDAHKALAMFRKLELPLAGVVENMALHVCGNCGHEEEIFGAGGGDELAAEYRVPVLARIPIRSSIRAGGDAGRPAVTDRDDPAARHFMQVAETVVKFLYP